MQLPVPGSSGDGHRLGDIADVFTGKALSRSRFTAEGPRMLKVGDLSGSMISWRDRPNCRVSVAWFEKNRHFSLQVGDICLTAAAHRPRYIGLKVDLVDVVPAEGAIPSAEVLVIRLRPGSPVAPEVLLHYLRGSAGYEAVQSLVRGSTAHLYPKDVAELLVPLSRAVAGQGPDYGCLLASSGPLPRVSRSGGSWSGDLLRWSE